MQIFLTSEDDIATCVVCDGEISQARFPSHDFNPLEDLLGAGFYQRQVLLDLGQATFIDSSGVGWLLTNHKNFLAAGGKLILHSVPPMVDQVLRLLQLHHMLSIKADRVAAMAAAGAAKGKA
jgi:anti-anti-sigma factor